MQKMISTERISDNHLLLNACGIDRINDRARGSLRQHGRIDYHILYIAAGTCHVKFEGDADFRPVVAGSIIFFRPHERQEYFFRSGSKSVSYYIHFTGRDCEMILSNLGIYGITVFNMGKSTAFEDTFEKMMLEFSLKKSGHEYYCAALLLQLLTIISRKHELSKIHIDRESEKRINHALEIMYKSISDDLSVDELAKECCLSSGHFSHLFKDVVGVSPHSYMIFLRMEKARDLLLNTRLPIREVGDAVGCPDQNYFSRLFKEQFGQSPSQYIPSSVSKQRF
jgi:AraC-like DNA-binding protein